MKVERRCGGGIFYGFESISAMEASKKNQVLGESMKQKIVAAWMWEMVWILTTNLSPERNNWSFAASLHVTVAVTTVDISSGPLSGLL